MLNLIYISTLNTFHNKREKARNATLIVEMQGNTTMLQDPESPNEEPRKFAFDYSYWSHDGYEVKEDGYISPVVPHYCDQVLPCFIYPSPYATI